MPEINWPVTFRAHFIASELNAAPAIAELTVSFDEQGKKQVRMAADRAKTMLALVASDMLVFKITKRFVIDCFSVDAATPLEHPQRFDSVADVLDYLEFK
ncbi:MAG: hypothetical protein ACI8P0_003054 [Planctomycetaceae bacterium]|jgi:hypothetical protein